MQDLPAAHTHLADLLVPVPDAILLLLLSLHGIDVASSKVCTHFNCQQWQHLLAFSMQKHCCPVQTHLSANYMIGLNCSALWNQG